MCQKRDLEGFVLEPLPSSFRHSFWKHGDSCERACSGQQSAPALNITHTCLTPMIASVKVEKILKGSLNLIPSPTPSFKIQIMGRKLCLMCDGKTLLGVVNKFFIFKSLLTTPSNVLPLYLKEIFLPIFWMFTEDEGDGIQLRLSS